MNPRGFSSIFTAFNKKHGRLRNGKEDIETEKLDSSRSV